MTNKPAWWLATWFGCGLSPKAPGTVGTLGALAVAVPLAKYAGFSPAWFAVLALGALYPAIWSAGLVARESGRKDPQIVVVDEVVGLWLTLSGAVRLSWVAFLLAFGLFRLFDIFKPPPIRSLERLPGGTGIVLDDMMAGAYGAVVLFAMGWFNLY